MKKLTPLEARPVRSNSPTSNRVSRLPHKTHQQRELLTGLRARFKLWLSTKDVEGVFGDGKWRLLKSIDAEGSLKAASESLRISYRKAWGDLKKAQDALSIALVEKQRGGSMGGRTTVTSQGKKWVRAYARFRGDIEKAVEKAYERHIKELVK
ncbi:hypothetical protein ES703_108199 [subsurface metagenome]